MLKSILTFNNFSSNIYCSNVKSGSGGKLTSHAANVEKYTVDDVCPFIYSGVIPPSRVFKFFIVNSFSDLAFKFFLS